MQGTLCFTFSRFFFGKWHTLTYHVPSGASAEAHRAAKNFAIRNFLYGSAFALKNQWINVADQVPGDTYEVLVKICGEPMLAYYDGKDWISLPNYEFIRPLYWMPIPKHPQDNTKEDII